MFLSMVIPVPSSPGRNIDVCLRPLIDELTQLGPLELWLMTSRGNKILL